MLNGLNFRGEVLSCLLAFTIFASVQSQCDVCPDGWTRFRSSCYLFNDDHKLSWGPASHNCSLHQSTLVTIESADEDTFLRDYLNRLFRDNKAGAAFWINGKNTITPGVWTWSDNSSLTYTNWSPGQPDEHGHHEHCLNLKGVDGFLWTDYTCYYNNYFICEKRMDVDVGIVG